MLSFGTAIASAIGTAAAEIFKALPQWIWHMVGGAVIGALLALYGAGVWFTGSWAPGEIPSVTKKEKTSPQARTPSPWDDLSIYEPPKDSVVVRDTVRITEEVRKGPRNGLTRATYDTELLDRPELTAPLSYAVIPFREGGRPDVSVGPDRVSVRLVNPNTAGYMQYSYQVPDDKWQLTASASVLYSHWRTRSGATRPVLDPRLALNISRRVGDYIVTGSGVLKTGRSWWGAQVTIERSLWSR